MRGEVGGKESGCGKGCRVRPGKISRSSPDRPPMVPRLTAPMPSLQQIVRILFPLLASCLFLLVDAALAVAQGFENLAFAIGLMVGTERFLAQQFELLNVGLQFLAKVQQVLAQNARELELRSPAAGA